MEQQQKLMEQQKQMQNKIRKQKQLEQVKKLAKQFLHGKEQAKASQTDTLREAKPKRGRGGEGAEIRALQKEVAKMKEQAEVHKLRRQVEKLKKSLLSKEQGEGADAGADEEGKEEDKESKEADEGNEDEGKEEEDEEDTKDAEDGDNDEEKEEEKDDDDEKEEEDNAKDKKSEEDDKEKDSKEDTEEAEEDEQQKASEKEFEEFAKEKSAAPARLKVCDAMGCHYQDVFPASSPPAPLTVKEMKEAAFKGSDGGDPWSLLFPWDNAFKSEVHLNEKGEIRADHDDPNGKLMPHNKRQNAWYPDEETENRDGKLFERSDEEKRPGITNSVATHLFADNIVQAAPGFNAGLGRHVRAQQYQDYLRNWETERTNDKGAYIG